MGKWCLHASSFIFDRIIIKVADNQDRYKSSVEFDFGPNQPTDFGVTCPWVTKISHFWTLMSLKPVGQSWSNFMCSIIGVGERLHEVLGQIDHGKLDSGERLLPFGLLVFLWIDRADYGASWTLSFSKHACADIIFMTYQKLSCSTVDGTIKHQHIHLNLKPSSEIKVLFVHAVNYLPLIYTYREFQTVKILRFIKIFEDFIMQD